MEATTVELRNKLREKGIFVERVEAPKATVNTDPNVNKVLGKPKVVAWASIFDILQQQEANGAFPNNRETSTALGIPSDVILDSRFASLGGPPVSRREVPVDRLWSTAVCASYIQEVIVGIGALGQVTTTVEKTLGAISTVEHEVVHEDPVAHINSVIASKGKSNWLEQATAYMIDGISQNPDIKPRTVPALLQISKDYVVGYLSQKGATKVRASAAPKKVPLRSRFYSLQKEKGDPLESFNATKEFQKSQTYNIDLHEWVEDNPSQTQLSSFNYCDGSCGYAHQCPIGKQLGRGAYGMVYQGRFWNYPCAIKSWGSMGADECSLFLSELEIMCKLRHPNVVQLFGASISPPNYCMIMELCERGDLHDLIHKHKISTTQPFSTLLQIAYDAAQGLHYMHENGAIHRDVKSSNFLVTNDWIAKAADFTVSAFIPKNEMQISKVPVGTPLYMAPEVYKRMPYNFKADVFSYGITICELFSGQEPHEKLVDERGWEHVVNMVCSGLRPPLPTNIPASLSALIQSCWQGDQKDRPLMSEVVQRLEAIAKESKVTFEERNPITSLHPAAKSSTETVAPKSRAITYSAGTKPQASPNVQVSASPATGNANTPTTSPPISRATNASTLSPPSPQSRNRTISASPGPATRQTVEPQRAPEPIAKAPEPAQKPLTHAERLANYQALTKAHPTEQQHHTQHHHAHHVHHTHTHQTVQQTIQPVVQPVVQPTIQPVVQPTIQPVVQPTIQPVVQPTIQPVVQPTIQPVVQPTIQPVVQPTIQPVVQPTIQPVVQPSPQPSPQVIQEQIAGNTGQAANSDVEIDSSPATSTPTSPQSIRSDPVSNPSSAPTSPAVPSNTIASAASPSTEEQGSRRDGKKKKEKKGRSKSLPPGDTDTDAAEAAASSGGTTRRGKSKKDKNCVVM